MSAPVKRIYRLTVESWPTPDGKPFDQQTEEFWGGIVDAYLNPGRSDVEYPEWLGDVAEWLDDPDYGGPSAAPGKWYRDAGLKVPVLRRRHWMSRAGADAIAKVLRFWGCDVQVEASDLITWADS